VPNLLRGEADARRVVHRVHHLINQSNQSGIERFYFYTLSV
jgi:hypothetical protein